MSGGRRWGLSGLLAILAACALPSQAQTVVRYLHTDALGSVVAVTDQHRVVIQRREYEPYGAQMTPELQDGPGYTGHVQDAATGLTYMQQRYYDPGIGRFLSLDPVTRNGSTGANFNRYYYSNSNPYGFTDPDGRVAIVNHRKNGNVKIEFPTKFTGPAANEENISAAKRHVAEMSGTYTVNGRTITVSVEVTEVNTKFVGGTPRAARNEIKLVDGPTSIPSGRSFAHIGGKYGEIDVTDRFTTNGVVPHEFGHLGGLDDLRALGTDLPDPLKGDGIMNRVPGVIDSATIEGIINSGSNIKFNEGAR